MKKSKEEIQSLLGRYLAGELKYNTKEYSLAYYYANKDKLNNRSKELYKERHKENKATYREKNREKINDYLIKWREDNDQYMSNYMKRRRIEKPAQVQAEEREKVLTRKQPLLRLAKIYKDDIDAIYKNRPENTVVDHIIPLQGKNVSGLNVPWNMQYISRSENSFKKHSFDGSYNNDSWKIRYKKLKGLTT